MWIRRQRATGCSGVGRGGCWASREGQSSDVLWDRADLDAGAGEGEPCSWGVWGEGPELGKVNREGWAQGDRAVQYSFEGMGCKGKIALDMRFCSSGC